MAQSISEICLDLSLFDYILQTSLVRVPPCCVPGCLPYKTNFVLFSQIGLFATLSLFTSFSRYSGYYRTKFSLKNIPLFCRCIIIFYTSKPTADCFYRIQFYLLSECHCQRILGLICLQQKEKRD